ncbi:hypothetical protein LWE61_12785 [Sphingobium sufflavum]|uniref:hypothetical protein n=1 Tax=Sphingobium sufflavum TaxID=1129547 RepID=UPI001F254C8A|nr:hypothetical protein [Sphingobium sufflavum]MCE7797431.1 hypothetical protein [Sphingobium sufflavum]
MKHALPGLLLLASTACHVEEAVTQGKLDRIADKCGLDRSGLKLTGKRGLQFQPDPSTKFDVVDCTLTELKRAKFPDMKMGFVGNERYEAETK